jgi:hypothetical protein
MKIYKKTTKCYFVIICISINYNFNASVLNIALLICHSRFLSYDRAQYIFTLPSPFHPQTFALHF